MNRILFVAASLAIFPISAFAQQSVTGAKDASSSSKSSTMSATTPVAGKTAAGMTETGTGATGNETKVTQPVKPAVKTAVPGGKTELHSMNTVTPRHSKPVVPAKTAEPAKS